MDTYKGHIEYKLAGQGSKSEGFMTYLITPSGESYRLYRKGTFDINDSFFKQFDQQEVEINGELENTGFICTISVKTSEGKLIHVPEQTSFPSDLVFMPKEEKEEASDEKTVCINEKKEPAMNKLVLAQRKKKKKSNNNFKRKKR
ncbi:Uncharacterised protein [uncultured Bacteroides sp.]|uniref:hypothetical protein n=1 Tax=Bacteroides TaxID=816 RepID=UPI00082269AE|nr:MULTISPECIES: hypothetical protein [Bacteroides]MCF2581090.1 hypothetical protein [Bacteroides caecigallinarum]MCF2738328.1 hypothetical protein [Bacteroides caecigallinarum]MCU6772538.1 hypothetical protein [Bacteroides cellulolyticus]MDN0052460.1 hypothetical protein [Bacteroides caecigallinarum]MDN0071936.1 hypothetical protein [Bacteroides caecigallinarum]